METALAPGLRRALEQIRGSESAITVHELARRLLALEGPIEPALARRLVGAALGQAAESLPERLEPHHLRTPEESRVAQIPLAEAEFAVVDLETTGLSAERDAIIEIGAVRIAALRRVEHFQTLVRPPGPGPLSDAIVALTGIDDAMLSEAAPASRALREFARWLGRAPSSVFVAHNAAFDARFTTRAFAHQGVALPRRPVLCTCRLSRRLLPTLGRYDLDHLSAHFGIANRARHRALGDAEATARVLVELLRGALAENPRTRLGDLLDLQRKPTRRRRRRARRR